MKKIISLILVLSLIFSLTTVFAVTQPNVKAEIKQIIAKSGLTKGEQTTLTSLGLIPKQLKLSIDLYKTLKPDQKKKLLSVISTQHQQVKAVKINKDAATIKAENLKLKKLLLERDAKIKELEAALAEFEIPETDGEEPADVMEPDDVN